MFTLLRFDLRRHARSAFVFAILFLQFCAFSQALHLLLQRYLEQQSVQIRNLSISEDLLTPLYGVLASLLVFSAPLLCMHSFAGARASRTYLFQRQTLTPVNYLLSRWLNGLFWQALLIVPAMLVILAFRGAAPIDLGQWWVSLLGLLLLASTCVAVATLASALCAQPVLAAIAGYAFLAALLALDLLPTGHGLFAVFHDFRDGILSAGGSLYFLSLSMLALTITYWTIWREQRAVAIAGVAVVLLLTSAALHFNHDFSRTRVGALAPATRAWLAHAPVTRLTVVAANADVRRAYARQLQMLADVQSAISIDGRPISELPATLRDQLPNHDGLLIDIAGRQDWLLLPQENLLAAVIVHMQKLTQLADAWLVFVEGHGERQLLGGQTRDLNILGEQLRAAGYTVAPLSLNGNAIPMNTRVLVLAHVHSALPDGDMQAILRYVQDGGNLLWLRDPDDAHLPALEQLLGVVRLDGTVFDLNSVKRGSPHPGIALVDHFVDHPAVRSLSTLAALPWAAALHIQHSDFHAQTLFFSDAQSVLVSDGTRTDVPDDAPREAFALAVALDRDHTTPPINSSNSHTADTLNSTAAAAPIAREKQQRIIVVGDSHFAADAAINNYGNRAMAMQLLRYLALLDQAPELPELNAADAVLLPGPFLMWCLHFGLPLLLPLLLVIWLGGLQWRWRRR